MWIVFILVVLSMYLLGIGVDEFYLVYFREFCGIESSMYFEEVILWCFFGVLVLVIMKVLVFVVKEILSGV